jgi:hypothetical protein
MPSGFIDIPTSASYPRRATIWADELTVLAGNALTVSAQTAQTHDLLAFRTFPAAGDSETGSFFLAAGTYTLSILTQKNNDRGIADWYIDDVKVISGQDRYNATLVVNFVYTQTVTIATSGNHILKMVVTGKNAASSNFYCGNTKMWLKPSVD